jgi:RNA polymerase primary sigma factor
MYDPDLDDEPTIGNNEPFNDANEFERNQLAADNEGDDEDLEDEDDEDDEDEDLDEEEEDEG